jgi:histidinol dehydrogenase
VDDVRSRGDAAVREYTAKFDECELDAPCVPIAELPEPDLPKDVTDAFDVAYDNIRKFHEAQATAELSVETMPGVVCRQVCPSSRHVMFRLTTDCHTFGSSQHV